MNTRKLLKWLFLERSQEKEWAISSNIYLKWFIITIAHIKSSISFELSIFLSLWLSITISEENKSHEKYCSDHIHEVNIEWFKAAIDSQTIFFPFFFSWDIFFFLIKETIEYFVFFSEIKVEFNFCNVVSQINLKEHIYFLKWFLDFLFDQLLHYLKKSNLKRCESLTKEINFISFQFQEEVCEKKFIF